jgi:uncharacterized protein (AIM24 family)
MPTPVLHPMSVTDAKSQGLTCRIEGSIVPTLHLTLDGTMPVMFEHHVFLWKSTSVDIKLMKLAGAFKRVLAGMPVLMTQAVGAGDISFSRDSAGQVISLHLAEGQSIFMREHQFLAASANVEYSFERVRGFGSMLLGGQGFWIDKFTGGQGGSVVWVHAHGNIFDVELAPGETIDVEPGAWVYRDGSVGYEQKVMGLTTGFLGGGGNFIFNRFTGPGRVGIQSGSYMGEFQQGDQPASGGNSVVGGIIGGLLKG